MCHDVLLYVVCVCVRFHLLDYECLNVLDKIWMIYDLYLAAPSLSMIIWPVLFRKQMHTDVSYKRSLNMKPSQLS